MTTLLALMKRRPMILVWVALSVVMVAILLWSSGEANLLPGQLAAVIVATIALAGACVWIVGWE